MPLAHSGRFTLLAAGLALAGCGATVQDPEDEQAMEKSGVVEAPAAEPGAPAPAGGCSAASVMISDGEHGANQINLIEGRGGYWYTYADEIKFIGCQ